MPFDPEGHTDDFYNKLYATLAGANGLWSYALVDTADDVVIVVIVKKTPAGADLALSYEHFDRR